jgi:hypothetical protein
MRRANADSNAGTADTYCDSVYTHANTVAADANFDSANVSASPANTYTARATPSDDSRRRSRPNLFVLHSRQSPTQRAVASCSSRFIYGQRDDAFHDGVRV